MTDEELVDMIRERLHEFSPAVAIERNAVLDHDDQVELTIVLNRTPLESPEPGGRSRDDAARDR